jgi:hypothetical protein
VFRYEACCGLKVERCRVPLRGLLWAESGEMLCSVTRHVVG